MPNGRRLDTLPQLLLGLLALAVAIVIAAFAVASAVKAVKRSRDTISVTGSAKEPITANLVTWNLRVHAEDADPAKASRRLQRDAGEVRAFLENGGLGDAITEPPVSTDETTEKRAGKRVTVYRLTQSFRITSRQIDRVETVAGDVSRLFEQGIPVSADSLDYVSTQLKKARVEALKAATADARRRAETLVEGLGGDLGSARKANVGVFQITPRNSTEVSDYGINDTSSRQKDVTAVVTVTFGLNG
jgi:uncharacterized protein